jgi:hypothetical protein
MPDRSRRRALAQLPLWLVVLASTGCAFTSMTIDASPTPRVVRPDGRGRGRDVVLVPLRDARPDASRCGMKKNGYGSETADIFCATPPPAVLTHLLRERLEDEGFHVLEDPAEADASTLRIAGLVTQVFVEPEVTFTAYTPEADIELSLVATTDEGLRAERRFYVKGRNVSMVGSRSNFVVAYDDALRQMVDRAVAAIVELEDRYQPTTGPVAWNEVAR